MHSKDERLLELECVVLLVQAVIFLLSAFEERLHRGNLIMLVNAKKNGKNMLENIIHLYRDSTTDIRLIVACLYGVFSNLLKSVFKVHKNRYVTYAFFELRILFRNPLELAFKTADLIHLLEAALQCALSVLQQSSLFLGQICSGDPLFDLIKLLDSRILRTVRIIGEVRLGVKLVGLCSLGFSGRLVDSRIL